MTDPIPRTDLPPRFWERPLSSLTPREWEALCDGCGKCCLNKLEDADTGEVSSPGRLPPAGRRELPLRAVPDAASFVPECVVLTPKTLPDIAYWMPSTCAYRLRHEGKPLPDWHPLLTGDPDSTHKAGMSVRGWTIPEFEVPEEDWEDHIIEEPLMFFASDNTSGAAPEIMAAVTAANDGYAASYGADALMDRVRAQVREVFEAPEAAVYLVADRNCGQCAVARHS